MAPVGDPVSLPIRRSWPALLMRLGLAAGVVVAWLAIWVLEHLMSFIFWTEPDGGVLLTFAPMLLAVPWLLYMALARGTVRVHHDALEIRHPRILRRPLTVPRTQVKRVQLDDGAATGCARFPTGDPGEPLLWTDRMPRRQRGDRALLGDAVLPNLAIELHTPLEMDAARDPITSIPVERDMAPPRRSTPARVLMVALEDLEGARSAFAGWPLERPDLAAVIPPQVAAANARIPQDAAGFVLVATFGAVLLTLELYPLLVVWAGVAFWFVKDVVQRRQEAAAAAREDLDRRAASMTASAVVRSLAVIDANLGTGASQGPPGWS